MRPACCNEPCIPTTASTYFWFIFRRIAELYCICPGLIANQSCQQTMLDWDKSKPNPMVFLMHQHCTKQYTIRNNLCCHIIANFEWSHTMNGYRRGDSSTYLGTVVVSTPFLNLIWALLMCTLRGNNTMSCTRPWECSRQSWYKKQEAAGCQTLWSAHDFSSCAAFKTTPTFMLPRFLPMKVLWQKHPFRNVLDDGLHNDWLIKGTTPNLEWFKFANLKLQQPTF